MKVFIATVFCTFVLGCSSTTIRSDENGKHTIQCLNNITRCHSKARNICDDGYLVTNRVRPQRVGDDTRYTLNVKCRQPTMY